MVVKNKIVLLSSVVEWYSLSKEEMELLLHLYVSEREDERYEGEGSRRRMEEAGEGETERGTRCLLTCK